LLAPERATRTDRKGVSNARYLAIKSYIENRLGDCDLSVASILNTFALTRRSLYRYFEPSGGVRAYIQSRRLARALTDLAAQPYSRGRVAAAARCWGFSSEAAFSRAVRREFGAPPGRLFDRSVAPGYRPHFPRSIDEWLKPSAS
jgi:AraC-like DNA-binding protein